VSRRSECNRVAEDRWVPFVTTDAFVVIDRPTPGLSANRRYPDPAVRISPESRSKEGYGHSRATLVLYRMRVLVEE
jgi:hypothetical protein